ncbi:MAG TPA: hypothetical protein VNV44_15560 [Solirubrobacteraceae bacterium]|jgi:hypothetical protein|nr:hypothetical protein [Solirubrobacteraceae bacterium]
MSAATIAALALALGSSVLLNLAYSREHDAAKRLPKLTLRDPVRSVRLLLDDRAWMRGFALEASGFALYAAALSLGSLALVQSVSAGGIGVLVWASGRAARRPIAGREAAGVALSFLGLLLLGISLTRASGEGAGGQAPTIALWLGATAAVAAVFLHVAPRLGLTGATARGLAGGLMFSIGDISTKVLTGGGVRLLFGFSAVAGYLAGTALLQSGYQAPGGNVVRVAGLATLATNALPIAAGTLLLEEPFPSGVFGALRAAAFLAVVLGAFLLAQEERPQTPSGLDTPPP